MAGPPDSILTQLNIRNNVRELHDSRKDLASWEKDMRSKEAAALKKKGVSKRAECTRCKRQGASCATCK